MRTCLQNILITGAVIAGVIWATQAYDASLRNPRFLDGWILATAMSIQLLLHLFRKQLLHQPGNESTWVEFHIYTGIFVAAIFAAHTTSSLPDTAFEWVLWVFFVLVVSSGMVGVYLTRAIPHRLEEHGERLMLERIPVLRSELARQVAVLSYQSRVHTASSAILDVYIHILHDFFKRPRNVWLHLRSSRRPIKQLMFELETVEADLDQGSLAAMHEIKGLVEHKNRLDFQYAHEGVLRVWLFIHVPATYGLLVLSIAHVVSIYAFRSGVE
ncbi:MAG: hypothetical protein ACI9XZ_003939 [Alphaproteobacteria bacterium]|jgi:hypothetical protein